MGATSMGTATQWEYDTTRIRLFEHHGHPAVCVEALDPPTLSRYILKDMPDEFDEPDHETETLPPAVAEFFARPSLIIYRDKCFRIEMLDFAELEVWEAPLMTVAEVRKQVIAHGVQPAADLTERDLNMLDAVVGYLTGETTLQYCGCGTAQHVEEGESHAHCKSCGAYLCLRCNTTGNHCDGCFRLLQESFSDIDSE